MNRSTRAHASRLAVLLLALGCAVSAAAEGDPKPRTDTAAAVPPREGEVLSYEDVDRIRPFLPPELWANRDFIFYEGMRMEVGPPFADYSPPEAFQRATRENAGKARLGPDGSLAAGLEDQTIPPHGKFEIRPSTITGTTPTSGTIKVTADGGSVAGMMKYQYGTGLESESFSIYESNELNTVGYLPKIYDGFGEP